MYARKVRHVPCGTQNLISSKLDTRLMTANSASIYLSNTGFCCEASNHIQRFCTTVGEQFNLGLLLGTFDLLFFKIFP